MLRIIAIAALLGTSVGRLSSQEYRYLAGNATDTESPSPSSQPSSTGSPTPAASVTPTASPPATCFKCYSGSSGQCQRNDGVCWPYSTVVNGVGTCPAGTVGCYCPPCASGSGPCVNAGTGVCYPYASGTSLCPAGSFQCYTDTGVAPSSSTSLSATTSFSPSIPASPTNSASKSASASPASLTATPSLSVSPSYQPSPQPMCKQCTEGTSGVCQNSNSQCTAASSGVCPAGYYQCTCPTCSGASSGVCHFADGSCAPHANGTVQCPPNSFQCWVDIPPLQASPSAAPAAASKPVDPVVITAVITCGSVLVIVATVTIGYIVVRTGKSKDLGKKARDSVMVPRGNKVAPDGKARSTTVTDCDSDEEAAAAAERRREYGAASTRRSMRVMKAQSQERDGIVSVPSQRSQARPRGEPGRERASVKESSARQPTRAGPRPPLMPTIPGSEHSMALSEYSREAEEHSLSTPQRSAGVGTRQPSYYRRVAAGGGPVGESPRMVRSDAIVRSDSYNSTGGERNRGRPTPSPSRGTPIGYPPPREHLQDAEQEYDTSEPVYQQPLGAEAVARLQQQLNAFINQNGAFQAGDIQWSVTGPPGDDGWTDGSRGYSREREALPMPRDVLPRQWTH